MSENTPSQKIKIDKEKLKSIDQWVRAFWMILFAVSLMFVRPIVFAMAFFQFFVVLFTGRPNGNMLRFSEGLSHFTYQVYLYITYGSDQRPFPFSPWPNSQK